MGRAMLLLALVLALGRLCDGVAKPGIVPAASGAKLATIQNARLTVQAPKGPGVVWRAWSGSGNITTLELPARKGALKGAEFLQTDFPVHLYGRMLGNGHMALSRIVRPFWSSPSTPQYPVIRGQGRIDMHVFFVTFGSVPACGNASSPRACEVWDQDRCYRTIQTDPDSVSKFYSTVSGGGIVVNAMQPVTLTMKPTDGVTGVLREALKSARARKLVPRHWRAYRPGRNFFMAVVLPNNWFRGELADVLGYGVAGRNIIVTRRCTWNVFAMELGHAVFLQHSGSWATQPATYNYALDRYNKLYTRPDGQNFFDDYADMSSVMGSTELVPDKTQPTWRGLAAPQMQRIGIIQPLLVDPKKAPGPHQLVCLSTWYENRRLPAMARINMNHTVEWRQRAGMDKHLPQYIDRFPSTVAGVSLYDSLLVRHEVRHATGRSGVTVLDAVLPVGASVAFPTFRIMHVSVGRFFVEPLTRRPMAYDPLAPVEAVVLFRAPGQAAPTPASRSLTPPPAVRAPRVSRQSSRHRDRRDS